jgi:putative transcriptional regulator
MNHYPSKTPQTGNLLISEPFLQDENFVRSVVLLCEHNSEGSFGLVLNKPSILHLSELVEELSFLESEIFVGGPVEQNTLHFIYFGEKKLDGSISIGEDLWWGGNFEDLVINLKNGSMLPDSIRFFIGYSGWGSGQLSDELSENTWIISDNKIDAEVLRNTPDELWRSVLKNMGGEFKIMANYPLDPRLN